MKVNLAGNNVWLRLLLKLFLLQTVIRNFPMKAVENSSKFAVHSLSFWEKKVCKIFSGSNKNCVCSVTAVKFGKKYNIRLLYTHFGKFQQFIWQMSITYSFTAVHWVLAGNYVAVRTIIITFKIQKGMLLTFKRVETNLKFDPPLEVMNIIFFKSF